MWNSITPNPALASRTRLVEVSLVVALACAALTGCGSSTSATKQSSPVEAREPDETKLSANTTRGRSEGGSDADQSSSALDREAVIAKADELTEQGDFAAAADALKRLLLVDPGDVEVLFRLAAAAANSGDLPRAIELLDDIPADHPEAGLPALGQSADWCFQLQRYDEAENRYTRVLERMPQAAPALRQLAYLLNRQGRRQEATRYVHELCKLGNVRQDELHSLIARSDAMYDAPSTVELPATGDNRYWPIGSTGEARKQFSEENFSEAVRLLRDSLATGSAPAAVVALYGRAAAEAQDEESFQWWLSRANEQTREFSEYWAAVGAHLLSQGRFEQATRALAEAIDRDPTDLRSLGRLRQALLVLGDEQSAQQIEDRWTKVRDSVRVNNRIAARSPPDAAAIGELVSILQALHRPLEAVLWQALQGHYRGLPPAERLALNQQRQQLIAAGKMFPDQSQRWCGLDLEKYPLPNLQAAEASTAGLASINAEAAQATPAVLENIAEGVGLRHTFAVESQPVPYAFAVYQMLGGGVVVLDYDLDGHSDLYFAQGGADPPEFRGDRSNQLYRHSGAVLVDVTEFASAQENQYSIGMTAGDWNQDGFPDLVVTNIGIDVLLINNGDGTFRRRPITDKANTNRVPSSVAMADLTGDQLPDVLLASYVDDPRRALKPPKTESGKPQSPILPSKFQPGADQLLQNDPVGDFTVKSLTNDARDNTTSLGLIVTDFDGRPGNEIFVGNDLKPNQLWVRKPDGGWSDQAPLRGCAFSFTGAATASMGIAAGDFENNGTLDLHITNYQDENASLYLREGDMYQDRNIQYRLAAPSRAVLGFGTQPIDYDNDGRRDLVVTNGHIDDAVDNSAPFEQPPQLFANLGGRFQLVDVTDPSGYWDHAHVGRGLARLDFDEDGQSDFAITHIERPSALLLNRTPTDHHWLQLKLVGTNSERDGIGATVRVRCGQREWIDWVMAGDGYLSHNEDLVCFGLGPADQIDELVVNWPTGDQQIFHDLRADCRLLIIEKEDKPYTLLATR